MPDDPQTLNETCLETAEEYLPKAAKLQVGRFAVMLEDLRSLAHEDRDVVRRYREKTVFGGNGKATEEPQDMGDILIADNITVGSPETQQQPSPQPKPMGLLGKAAVAAALLGVGAGVGVGVPWLLGAFDKPDANTEYQLQFPQVVE